MEASGPPADFEPEPWDGRGLRRGPGPPREVGRIVNISSVHGLLQAAGSAIYETGKAAVNGLTRQMAIDFGPLGITVNAIAPGHMVTENLEGRPLNRPRSDSCVSRPDRSAPQPAEAVHHRPDSASHRQRKHVLLFLGEKEMRL